MKRAVVLVVLLSVLAVVLGLWWQTIMVHASQETGTSSESSRSYAYWSGFGSVVPWSLGILTAVVGTAVVAARHHNCASRGCWRLTQHTVEDPETHVKYRQCHKHHPGIPDEHSHHGIFRNHMSDEHMANVHDRAMDKDPRIVQ